MSTDRPTPTLPLLWCLAAAALFGASTPASKLLLDGRVGPVTLAGLLYLGAALATLPFVRQGGSVARRWDRRNLQRLAGAVVFGGVFGPIALLAGLRGAPAASVSLWLNLETTATALLAWGFFREHLDLRGWVANGLVVVSSVVLASPESFSLAPAALLVVLAAVCWGIDNNLTAIIDGFTPSQTTFAKGLIAGLVNLCMGLWWEGARPTLDTVALALTVGALAYGASIVLYIRGAQQLGATRSQMLFATAPFLGVLVSWLGLGEAVEVAQVLSGGGMVAALVVLFSSRHEHEHAHPATIHTHAHRHDDGHHDHVHDGLPKEVWHTHEHAHEAVVHRHPHVPDLHHRHGHG